MKETLDNTTNNNIKKFLIQSDQSIQYNSALENSIIACIEVEVDNTPLIVKDHNRSIVGIKVSIGLILILTTIIIIQSLQLIESGDPINSYFLALFAGIGLFLLYAQLMVHRSLDLDLK